MRGRYRKLMERAGLAPDSRARAAKRQALRNRKLERALRSEMDLAREVDRKMAEAKALTDEKAGNI